jgi:hypothetical protein
MREVSPMDGTAHNGGGRRSRGRGPAWPSGNTAREGGEGVKGALGEVCGGVVRACFSFIFILLI